MNSMLKMYGRPTVMFDIKNKQHRKWAHQFVKHRSWGQCPVQFALPIGEDNVYTMIMRQLSRYYLQKEFGALPDHEHDQWQEQLVANSPQFKHLEKLG